MHRMGHRVDQYVTHEQHNRKHDADSLREASIKEHFVYLLVLKLSDANRVQIRDSPGFAFL